MTNDTKSKGHTLQKIELITSISLALLPRRNNEHFQQLDC